MAKGHRGYEALLGGTPRLAGLRKVQLVLDALSVLFAMAAAPTLQGLASEFWPGVRTLAPFSEYALLAYLVLPLWLALGAVLDLHRTFEAPPRLAHTALSLLQLHGLGALALGALHFATNAVVNRSLVLAFFVASYALMFGQRALALGWARLQRSGGRDRTVLLCVGQPSRRMHRFLESAARRHDAPIVVGYLADEARSDTLSMPPPDAPALRKLGDLSALERVLERHAVTHVVFFAPYERPELVADELGKCEDTGVPASFVVDAQQLVRSTPRIHELYDHCVIEFDPAPKAPEALALKHGIDPLLALVALLALGPLLAGVAVAILVTMGRPVLFVQERAGRFGRPFKMLKFRTMMVGAEHQRAELLQHNEMSGPVFKLSADPRVTPLGRFLRATSIDELPQLLNVLVGSMSLVGPRPLPVYEQSQIRGWQRRRLSMKPGITCLWQISGRSDVDFEEWMLLDLRYVEQWGLGLDLEILLRTIPAVLRRRGAR